MTKSVPLETYEQVLRDRDNWRRKWRTERDRVRFLEDELSEIRRAEQTNARRQSFSAAINGRW